MGDAHVLVVSAIPSRSGIPRGRGLQDHCHRCDVYEWLREVCSYRLLYNEDLKLGGTGHVTTNIVEIDEFCFSHKPKVNAYCSHI